MTPVADRQDVSHPHAIVAAPRAASGPQFVLAADLGCNAIYVYRLEDGWLVPHEPTWVTTRPGAGPRRLAFHCDGRRLYATNLGQDSVAAYGVGDDGRLTVVEIVPSRGAGSQNIAITPNGRLLLVATMEGDSLVVFRIDATTGRLTAVGEPVKVANPSAAAINC